MLMSIIDSNKPLVQNLAVVYNQNLYIDESSPLLLRVYHRGTVQLSILVVPCQQATLS
jgi:hypothetical protein